MSQISRVRSCISLCLDIPEGKDLVMFDKVNSKRMYAMERYGTNNRLIVMLNGNEANSMVL